MGLGRSCWTYSTRYWEMVLRHAGDRGGDVFDAGAGTEHGKGFFFAGAHADGDIHECFPQARRRHCLIVHVERHLPGLALRVDDVASTRSPKSRIDLGSPMPGILPPHAFNGATGGCEPTRAKRGVGENNVRGHGRSSASCWRRMTRRVGRVPGPRLPHETISTLERLVDPSAGAAHSGPGGQGAGLSSLPV